MSLHPQAQVVCDALASVPKIAPSDETLEGARNGMAMFLAAGAGTPVDVESVTELDAGGVPVRVVRPTNERGLPIVVHYHGGGWTLGRAADFDFITRRIAMEAHAIVVSVDYRLAPEHPFPAALDDAWHALQWVADHGAELGGDPALLAVMGDSAGGNLAAVCAIQARDAGGPELALQVLVYPVTDCEFDTESYLEHGEGKVLEADTMRWFFDCYTRAGADPADWHLSPLRAPDLRKVAPALVITASHDPLRDEGEAYAQRLREAGVPVTLERYDGMIHGFVGMVGMFDAGGTSAEQVGAALRSAFGTLAP
ncbi:MAG TPA: alpha/beta hydrolase [Acidimicrobiia bacterium]|nr:alpha/beta hydrolase [Acidimicrobiia bacterium]